jgi:hypothetical protein
LTSNSFPDKNIGHTWHQAVRGMTVAAVQNNERIICAGFEEVGIVPPGGEKHMRRSSKPWVRALVIALALLMGLTFSAPPTAAGEGKALPARPLAAATAAKLATLAPSARAFTQETPASSSADDRSFFRRPAGVAALVLMAAGVGFAIYSINHDRKPVKSPIR